MEKEVFRILVVDDEKCITRTFINDFFKLLHEITVSNSAEEGIEELKQNEYSLVISDLNMPGLGGLGLIRWIKENTPDTEIIIVSGNIIDNAEVNSLGISEYIIKPLDIGKLRDIASRIFERSNL